MILMDCNNLVLGNVLGILRNILNIVWIAGPILAILSLTINFIKLSKDPDDKKIPVKIKNSFIALILLFLVPTIVNASMLLLDKDSEISACWSGDVNPQKYDSAYIDPYGNKDKSTLYNDIDEYEKGEKRKDDDTSNSTGDMQVTACGSLEYCNKYLTSMVNNSKRLSEAIYKNNAPVEYSWPKSASTWQEAISLAEKGKLVATTCVVPANWGVTDTIGKHRVLNSVGSGGFHNYSGVITKYTKQYKFDGSMSVKTAIQKGIIQPGDIIGVSGHTFSIYQTNKDGSAIVFDGGHQFTNKCKGHKKCSPMFTYSSNQNSGYKLLQLIRWVK